ncbi:dynamin family protein [Halobacillus litoralis]|uniref:dynamin family protein n=1 Tax=Halobacillus litoralis TaxID=45668 RepID=UPI001CFEAE1A|nr:dynamin family protein [Halobacillus litoralis]
MKDERSNQLLERIEQFSDEWQKLSPHSPQIKKLEELQQDMRSDYFTLVTVGEFKNGKTTFLNALIEEPLLPVNVTPTTAVIHMLYKSSANHLEVLRSDGSKEAFPLTMKALERFTAKADFDPNEINYIKVPAHPPFLEDQRVVLVDTPGVNDLNEHRIAVTHRFVPRADGILFMVDIHSPFRKSEMEFLSDYLLKKGVDNIIFIANFIDQLEDEDEITEAIEFANRRLSQWTGRKDHTIIPISALEALEGVTNEDKELYRFSNIDEVKQAIQKLIDHGDTKQEKIKRFENRLEQICFSISQEIENRAEVLHYSVEELEVEKKQLNRWISEKDVWGDKLDEYIKERTDEITFMTLKSVDYFEEQLKRDIEEAVEYHHGDNIQNFVEKHLSRKIKKDITNWVEQRSPSLYTLFKKLENEISEGLSNAFQRKSIIQSENHQVGFTSVIDLDSPETSNTTVISGVLTGGLTVFALALGAGILAPVIGFAGAPLVGGHLKRKAWERVKPDILEATDQHITAIFRDLRNHFHSYINQTAQEIQTGSNLEFQRMLTFYQEQLNNEIEEKKKSVHVRKDELERLIDYKERILQVESSNDIQKEPIA